MNILVTICARGGSKGIPMKNIKDIAGKPLIGYTIEVAQKFQDAFSNVDVVLSTDSEKIRKVAALFGLNSDYIRPDYLANDTVGKVDVIADVLRFYEIQKNIKYDYVLDLDVTSPLRNLDDLVNAFKILEANSYANNLYSVSPAARNPYFNMVEQHENGYYYLVKELQGNIYSRQVAPVVYDMNASFYFYCAMFFDKGYKSTETDKTLVYIVPHICFDLDNPLDFDFMSFLLENNKLDFKL